jgi:hypothetical protein
MNANDTFYGKWDDNTPDKQMLVPDEKSRPELTDADRKLLEKWAYEQAQCDDFSVRISRRGNYCIEGYNDHPLQHGNGRRWTLTPDQFNQIKLSAANS